MFTGIIETIGTVRGVVRKGGSLSFTVEIPEIGRSVKPGDSIAVNGVCLTATDVQKDTVKMDVSEETFAKTTLRNLSPGAKVNIEPALSFGKPLSGHLVSGHVDGIGKIEAIHQQRTQVEMQISYPLELGIFIVDKGSIAVDGVSLTAGEMKDGRFTVYLIPYTLKKTTLNEKRTGDEVNLEVDMLARYVWKIVSAMKRGEKGEDLMELLEKYEYVKRGNNKR